jgi:hypothetical protein
MTDEAVTPAVPEPAPAVQSPHSILAEIEARLISVEGVWAADLRGLVSKLKAHL